MSQPRKTLRQYAAEIDQWVAQGWLTGHETFIELQDMATMSELMALEAEKARGYPRPDVQAEIFGIKGRFREVLAPLRQNAPHNMPLLDVLRPILEAHPGMSAGMALYWLRRQPV
jgi:hypothetical protein